MGLDSYLPKTGVSKVSAAATIPATAPFCVTEKDLTTEYITINGTQLPWFTDSDLKGTPEDHLRQHANFLYNTLGPAKIGVPVPCTHAEMRAWVSTVQRLHLERHRVNADKTKRPSFSVQLFQNELAAKASVTLVQDNSEALAKASDARLEREVTIQSEACAKASDARLEKEAPTPREAEKEAELREKIEDEKKQAMKDEEAKQAEIERLQKERRDQANFVQLAREVPTQREMQIDSSAEKEDRQVVCIEGERLDNDNGIRERSATVVVDDISDVAREESIHMNEVEYDMLCVDNDALSPEQEIFVEVSELDISVEKSDFEKEEMLLEVPDVAIYVESPEKKPCASDKATLSFTTRIIASTKAMNSVVEEMEVPYVTDEIQELEIYPQVPDPAKDRIVEVPCILDIKRSESQKSLPTIIQKNMELSAVSSMGLFHVAQAQEELDCQRRVPIIVKDLSSSSAIPRVLSSSAIPRSEPEVTIQTMEAEKTPILGQQVEILISPGEWESAFVTGEVWTATAAKAEGYLELTYGSGVGRKQLHHSKIAEYVRPAKAPSYVLGQSVENHSTANNGYIQATDCMVEPEMRPRQVDAIQFQAARYGVGDLVEYYSAAHNRWLQSHIVKVEDAGYRVDGNLCSIVETDRLRPRQCGTTQTQETQPSLAKLANLQPRQCETNQNQADDSGLLHQAASKNRISLSGSSRSPLASADKRTPAESPGVVTGLSRKLPGENPSQNLWTGANMPQYMRNVSPMVQARSNGSTDTASSGLNAGPSRSTQSGSNQLGSVSLRQFPGIGRIDKGEGTKPSVTANVPSSQERLGSRVATTYTPGALNKASPAVGSRSGVQIPNGIGNQKRNSAGSDDLNRSFSFSHDLKSGVMGGLTRQSNVSPTPLRVGPSFTGSYSATSSGVVGRLTPRRMEEQNEEWRKVMAQGVVLRMADQTSSYGGSHVSVPPIMGMQAALHAQNAGSLNHRLVPSTSSTTMGATMPGGYTQVSSLPNRRLA